MIDRLRFVLNWRKRKIRKERRKERSVKEGIKKRRCWRKRRDRENGKRPSDDGKPTGIGTGGWVGNTMKDCHGCRWKVIKRDLCWKWQSRLSKRKMKDDWVVFPWPVSHSFEFVNWCKTELTVLYFPLELWIPIWCAIKMVT